MPHDQARMNRCRKNFDEKYLLEEFASGNVVELEISRRCYRDAEASSHSLNPSVCYLSIRYLTLSYYNIHHRVPHPILPIPLYLSYHIYPILSYFAISNSVFKQHTQVQIFTISIYLCYLIYLSLLHATLFY